jgi:hypothetical protein
MADDRPAQTFATHTRWHPMFHFFAFPVLALNLLWSLYILFRHPVPLALWNSIVSAALLASCFLARYYGLRNQDRLIRLEERVRLSNCLPEDLRSRINELSMDDLIGLRFCGDNEVAEVTRAVLAGEAKGRAAIKQKVQNWRADYHRL